MTNLGGNEYMKTVIVIGAGIGGITVSARLASSDVR